MFLLIIEIIIIGVLLWLANPYIPMDSKIKVILNVVVVLLVILWLLNVFGVLAYLGGDVPRLRH